MKKRSIGTVFSLAVLTLVVATSDLAAQQTRKLAPGVLTTIPVDPHREETFAGPRPLVEVMSEYANLRWKPNYSPETKILLDKAKGITVRRQIWNLEFAFKPLRMMAVDIPQPNAKMQRKLIWYMVYRVKNNGNELKPVTSTDDFGHETYETELVNRNSARFFPLFYLETMDLQKRKIYMDRIIPAAQDAIQKRERPGVRLYNTAEICLQGVPLSTPQADRSVWGVVTWEAVDPNVDYLSVYVRGLTNAYKFVDPDGGYRPGDAYNPAKGPAYSRRFAYKTLRLNFWRPGDDVDESEEEVTYGVPIRKNPEEQQKILEIYGLERRLDHLWLYR